MKEKNKLSLFHFFSTTAVAAAFALFPPPKTSPFPRAKKFFVWFLANCFFFFFQDVEVQGDDDEKERESRREESSISRPLDSCLCFLLLDPKTYLAPIGIAVEHAPLALEVGGLVAGAVFFFFTELKRKQKKKSQSCVVVEVAPLQKQRQRKQKSPHVIAFLKPEGAMEISTPRESAARAGLGTDGKG